MSASANINMNIITQSETPWISQVSGEEFHTAIEAAKKGNVTYGHYVDLHSVEDYNSMKSRSLLNSKEFQGIAGVAVTNEGDIVSVFKNASLCKIQNVVGNYLIPTAMKHGGTHLDCYGAGLQNLYAQARFTPVAKVAFDPAQRPLDWPEWETNKPPIIFMVVDQKSSVPTTEEAMSQAITKVNKIIESLKFSSYGEAKEVQKKQLAEQKQT